MKNSIAAGVCLLAVCLFPAMAATRPTNELMREISESAREIRDNAEQLDMVSRRPNEYSRDVNLAALQLLKDEINSLRPQMARLEAVRDELPAAEHQRLDGVLQGARALAQNANSAILRLYDGEAIPSLDGGYRKLVAAVYRDAESLLKLVNSAH